MAFETVAANIGIEKFQTATRFRFNYDLFNEVKLNYT